jgi:predicted HicB family RNase H-like nuclease
MKECLEHKGYLGSVEFDAEENVLHGEVIGIRDVVTFEGVSVDELRRAFQESVDDYVDHCKQRGEKPDKPWSGRFVVRITSDLHRDLSLMAVRAGVSLNTFVSDLLARGVGGHVRRKESSVRTTIRTTKSRRSRAAASRRKTA